MAGIGPDFARAYHFKWKAGPHEAPQANGTIGASSRASVESLTPFLPTTEITSS